MRVLEANFAFFVSLACVSSGVSKSNWVSLFSSPSYLSIYLSISPSSSLLPRARMQPNVQEEAEPQVQFSGEEVFGKYLDLQALHNQYYALPQTEKVGR